ncbi:MAG: radical SAM family heme chaperone HemW [Chloroflexi bacterium]|nr:radical SAM family heme chaperone HemW [Chloroflexota bacterium]
MMASLSLYIHIPFCRAKCLYCNFNSYPGLEALIPDYVSALIEETGLWAVEVRSYQVQTIYLGGGTPSLLNPGEVAQILGQARATFSVATEPEVTLEANPGTVDQAWLEAARKAGVSRLSLGVQSFQHGFLRLLGRIHTTAQARQAFRWARQASFDNINLDLIYGLPHQTLLQWRSDLEAALALSPEHISLYCLTLEPGTPLADALPPQARPDPDLAAEMYALSEDMLGTEGFDHYEISNWAREGRRCRHNLTYWHNLPYLGLGAGAHSYLHGYRFANAASPQDYIRRLRASFRKGIGPRRFPQVAWARRVGRQREMAETAILGLRLGEGLNLAALAQRFGRRPERIFARQRQELQELELAEEVGGYLRLTPRGRLLGNQAFLRFLP